jgi:SAM-dependent methyltransferase
MIWPLPALLAWAASWATFVAVQAFGAVAAAAFVAGGLIGTVLATTGGTPWRRVFIAGGFPLSFAVAGAAGALPAWAWLLALALLAFVYPFRTWGDAPVFPTPEGALRGLARVAPLAPGAAVLDAGCGLGAGLRELNREYPEANSVGIEWSRPLSVACAWRCRFAEVRRGDLWAADWSSFALVYLFQRPESMPGAVEKATRELAPGAWLASLEFPAPRLVADHVVEALGGRRVWLYRAPFRTRVSGTSPARRIEGKSARPERPVHARRVVEPVRTDAALRREARLLPLRARP